MNSVTVYDATTSDKYSAVRGVGRYLKLLKENFPEWRFTADLKFKNTYKEITFINPFLNFLAPPLSLTRIAKRQVAVILDLIPLKYPAHFPAGLKGKINIFLNKLSLKNYDKIVTISNETKKDIVGMIGIPEEKITVIYPCLDRSFLNQKSKNKNEDYCLYVGDVTWNKNIFNLAKAIKIADVTCVFVGKVFETLKQPLHQLNSPWQKEFKQFVLEVKDDKRFIFPGYVSDEKLIGYYQRAAVNILPSRDEGFGFSWLESASQNCPSVLSNIAILKEISDSNALFCDPDSPKDMADKIKTVMKSKNLRLELGKAAYKRSRFFSPEKFKDEFFALL